MSRILFSSYHSYIDPTSGAAISTRSTLRALVRQGWSASVFCGSLFDAPRLNADPLSSLMSCFHGAVDVKRVRAVVDGRATIFRLARFNDDGIDATVLLPDVGASSVSRALADAFFRVLSDKLRELRSDVFVTYGGDPRIGAAAQKAKKLCGATVFTLHNLAYRRRELFEPFDAVVVPSKFARVHYQKALGVEAEVVPPIIDEAKVVVSQNTRRFATFVNPSPDKGGYFFVGIARELNRLRPDIPLLVVDSRSTVDSFKKSATARGLTNLYSLENVADPRAFYSQSRVVLVPSLCEESFGRVVVEAGFNGIPVLCSDRGALPEVCGVPELILPVSKRFDATSRVVPEPAETKLWVERIARLWDDEDYAQKKGAALRERVARYSQRRVEETTRRFLTRFARSTPSG